MEIRNTDSFISKPAPAVSTANGLFPQVYRSPNGAVCRAVSGFNSPVTQTASRGACMGMSLGILVKGNPTAWTIVKRLAASRRAEMLSDDPNDGFPLS
ncbi:uncharacterized protein RCO7_15085 [Rhynchosporium graminicola]|uniref:Uncharacterized protein n=1 Tax=Rhynchosporium graminicola TaxID=2792576 RepID=A0A1E1LJN8_9HELO|nr:uncharacterized protein RCO7_15085 [Rhynchosporium commune]